MYGISVIQIVILVQVIMRRRQSIHLTKNPHQNQSMNKKRLKVS